MKKLELTKQELNRIAFNLSLEGQNNSLRIVAVDLLETIANMNPMETEAGDLVIIHARCELALKAIEQLDSKNAVPYTDALNVLNHITNDDMRFILATPRVAW